MKSIFRDFLHDNDGIVEICKCVSAICFASLLLLVSLASPVTKVLDTFL